MPRILVECLDVVLLSDKITLGEDLQCKLVHGASLLQEIEIEKGSAHEMHQVVRQLITLEAVADKTIDQEIWIMIINALHTCPMNALQSTGDSFSSPPTQYCSPLSRAILPNAAEAVRSIPL